MGGHAPTAERTVGPARVIAESLTLKPGIREHNRRQSGRASVRIDDQSHLGNGVCFPLRLLFHCPVARERQNRCIGGQADHCTGYKQHPSHGTHTHGADGSSLAKAHVECDTKSAARFRLASLFDHLVGAAESVDGTSSPSALAVVRFAPIASQLWHRSEATNRINRG